MSWRTAEPVVCPTCAADTVNILEYTSSRSQVWYLRCVSCCHVWTLPKSPGEPRPVVRHALTSTDIQVQRDIRTSDASAPAVGRSTGIPETRHLTSEDSERVNRYSVVNERDAGRQ
jgi:hypothetical protein